MKFYLAGFCAVYALLCGESSGSYEKPRSGMNPLRLIGRGHRVQLVEVENASERIENSKSLIQASKDGDLGRVRSLVIRGGDINFKGDNGVTPLIGAAENRRDDVVRYLLRNKAFVDSRRTDNLFSPLMISCRNNDLETTNLLLRFGANTDLKSYTGLTAFNFAMDNDNKEILKELLISRKGPDAQLELITDENERLLFYAVKSGRENVVKYCIENLGTNANARGIKGETPLIIAAKDGYTDIVKYLLEQKADPDVQMYNDKSTALMFACIGGFRDIVKILLENSADVNILDKYKNSPLIFSTNHSHTEIAEMLMVAGADISHKNNSGDTARSIASSYQKNARNNFERNQWKKLTKLLKGTESNLSSKGLLR